MADFLFPLPQQNNERGAYAVPTWSTDWFTCLIFHMLELDSLKHLILQKTSVKILMLQDVLQWKYCIRFALIFWEMSKTNDK